MKKKIFIRTKVFQLLDFSVTFCILYIATFSIIIIK